MPRAAWQVARPGLGDPTRPDGIPSRGPEPWGGQEAAHVRAALGDDYVSHPDTQLRGLVVIIFRGRERVRSPPPSGRSAPRSGGVLVVRLRCSRAEKAWCSANSPGSRWLAIRASSVNEPPACATFLRANRRAGTRVRRDVARGGDRHSVAKDDVGGGERATRGRARCRGGRLGGLRRRWLAERGASLGGAGVRGCRRPGRRRYRPGRLRGRAGRAAAGPSWVRRRASSISSLSSRR